MLHKAEKTRLTFRRRNLMIVLIKSRLYTSFEMFNITTAICGVLLNMKNMNGKH